MKKLLPILLIIIAVIAYAEEDCIFDESTYMKFIKEYSAENKNAKIGPNGRTLLINRNNEEITVQGGGCIHLGVAIESRTNQNYSEEQFLQKVLSLSIEFGDWLINTEALKESIEKGKFQKIDGGYFIDVDAMTVFEASCDDQGKINVDFYIN